MAIRAEESVWFEVSYIGSRSAFGVLPDGALEARRVDTRAYTRRAYGGVRGRRRGGTRAHGVAEG